MRKTFLAACAALAVLTVALPRVSFAGGGPRDHLGFFLRLTAGGTYGSSGTDDFAIGPVVGDFDFTGWGGDFTIALGGCVSENFALHGTLFSWSMSDPDAEFEGEDVGQLDGTLSMNAYGGGVTYFIMPVNLYLSGNVGLGFLSIDAGGDEQTSDAGFALDLSIGKEWWVGNSWGLGLAGAFGYHSIEDFSGWNAGVRFSATFN